MVEKKQLSFVDFSGVSQFFHRAVWLTFANFILSTSLKNRQKLKKTNKTNKKTLIINDDNLMERNSSQPSLTYNNEEYNCIDLKLESIEK